MNRADFQDLADLRIAEAECLFQNGLFDGAYYLAGYAVEAGLKACIAKLTQQPDFPSRNTNRDYYTHDFEILLKTAGLDRILSDDRKANRDLDNNWKLVGVWKEDCRYEQGVQNRNRGHPSSFMPSQMSQMGSYHGSRNTGDGSDYRDAQTDQVSL